MIGAAGGGRQTEVSSQPTFTSAVHLLTSFTRLSKLGCVICYELWVIAFNTDTHGTQPGDKNSTISLIACSPASGNMVEVHFF